MTSLAVVDIPDPVALVRAARERLRTIGGLRNALLARVLPKVVAGIVRHAEKDAAPMVDFSHAALVPRAAELDEATRQAIAALPAGAAGWADKADLQTRIAALLDLDTILAPHVRACLQAAFEYYTVNTMREHAYDCRCARDDDGCLRVLRVGWDVPDAAL
jgi:hypothetical protein